MFIEPNIGRFNSKGAGWIEVICGCMFSGKTEELIRRLNRSLIAKQKVEIFKPSVDTRFHIENVVSHNENSIKSTPVENAYKIISHYSNYDVVGIDEAQFFNESIVDVSVKLANDGCRVIVAGLDMDFAGKPFGCMPQLMAVAEFVTKVHAICAVCGNLASYSFRLSNSKEKVVLGEKDIYQARCRGCFEEGMKSQVDLNPPTLF